MKKGLLVITIVVFLMSNLSFTVYGEENNQAAPDSENLAENAKSAILMERDTGKVIFNKNEHEQLSPASMTKIMTLLLIMEAIDEGKLKLDETIRVSERAASMGGSQIFLEAGEEMSVNDLLKGVAVASGNDASVALAERVAGSEKSFVKRMNEKAKELNLKNTKFQNATGLPAEDHYSTAYDMSVMAKELLKYETITNYTSIYEDYLRKGEDNEFWLVNTNRLVKFYPGVDGLKTGYTNDAKYCLTATAEKEDMRVIAVVMGAGSTKDRNADVTQMLDYAFNHFQTNKLFEKGDKITELNMLKAENNHLDVVASESISTLHKKGESMDKVTTEIKLHEDYTLPISKGDSIGELLVKNEGKIISRSDLTVEEDVEKASYLTLFKRTLQRMAKNE
ncbi:D-alanyl-D-alanine carboxypeptidase family protein [Virgibacillus salexigens]|uniref:serine-type D-Ala-D-Ala carboxypeptidase n=1 Tax=Virgibacillus massiliensis TaxID=1462526 RepID=A0A024QCR2_9BACI|nr:D-alanyl-D-alanine carboxypeptidase family protein [Virgibacillus massiliensis]CDQ39746.1 D-alanyl-D-alanine carboxypeptidase DacF precursor [Virgibacillus massiliensis]